MDDGLSCSDCIALGLETTGAYVSNVAAGGGISVAGGGGEGSTPTISVNVGAFTCPTGEYATSIGIVGGAIQVTGCDVPRYAP